MKLILFLSMLLPTAFAFADCTPIAALATYEHNATNSLTYCGSMMKIQAVNSSADCKAVAEKFVGQTLYFGNGVLENGHDCVTPDLGTEPQQLLIVQVDASYKLVTPTAD